MLKFIPDLDRHQSGMNFTIERNLTSLKEFLITHI